MSYAPFDGVLLDDLRPPIPWALATALHLHVAERLGGQVSRDAIEARAGACSDLIAHGLFPPTLRYLSKHGLDPGNPAAQHSLSSVINHLENYLEAVSLAGYIEPNAALWEATNDELNNRRGLWVERVPEDGPLQATLKDLQPARLRALACLPRLGGAVFRLATQRGGASGLFGRGQPLVDWFLDGLENHGQAFTADIQLSEPEGWGEAPWSEGLDTLFEGPLNLNGYETCFQRALVEGPLDLLRHAIEQIIAWINQGLSQRDITLIHPHPEKIRDFMELLLNAEGVSLYSPSSLRPLIQSDVWIPIWSILQGLCHLDPHTAATGLHTSKRAEVRAWAELLAASDQTGREPFETSAERLPERHRAKIADIWQMLLNIKTNKRPPSEWCEALDDLISSKLRLPLTPEGFYAPMGLLKECWGGFLNASKKRWDFEHMIGSLRLFLESARAASAPNAPDGVQLLSPSALLDDWEGAIATLILDLSEGAWPAAPITNPDLDFNCRAAINTALLKASEGHEGPFPPALQRFWLPRAEYKDQIPRAFQRDAYAFNKVLAMTRQHLVALSPAQDESGRNLAQGAFWTAIEGAAQWTPDVKTCASNLRMAWDGARRAELADERSKSARAMGREALFNSSAPDEDRIPEIRAILQNQNPYISPTVLESLARCPFRAVAERVWRFLDASDAAGLTQRAVGTVTHNLLQSLYQPVILIPNWPEVFVAHYNLKDTEAVTLEALVNDHWQKNQHDWLTEKLRLDTNQYGQVREQIEALTPNIAAWLKNDIEAACPAIPELALLFPDKVEITARSNSDHCYKYNWRRSITGLEQKLGPIELEINAEGAKLPVAGIVDRVELWEYVAETENLSFYRVIDYKTTTKQRLNAYAADDAPFTSHLQTPLYTWMVMKIFNSRATSVLAPLRDAAPKPFANHLRPLHEIASKGGKWQEKLARTLAHLDARIEQGDYPPTPEDHCHNCPYPALCARPVDITALDDFEDGDD